MVDVFSIYFNNPQGLRWIFGLGFPYGKLRTSSHFTHAHVSLHFITIHYVSRTSTTDALVVVRRFVDAVSQQPNLRSFFRSSSH